MGTFSKNFYRKIYFKGTKRFTETLNVTKTKVKESTYSHFAFTFEHFTH